jgi:anti-sigma regulatory factor (Ser/Thr protein kinase)
MNTRRFFTLLLFFIFTPSLFGEERISEILEHWLVVESALYNWQGSPTGNAENDETENLFSSLEHFNKILEDFTGSLLFRQYEGTGLLPEGSGKTACRITQELITSVKAAEHQDALSIKPALVLEADAIRRELYSWSGIDTQISSNVFLRSIYIFGVFTLCVIGMIILALLLYRALRHSQIQEQDSSDFSRASMLVQEKQRALISAELHDTVLQDMGRLLQISKDTPSTDHIFSELAQKIMIRTREICRMLMPPDFSRLALTDSFLQLCADFEKRAAVECRAIIDKNFTADMFSPQMQLQVYRIVQEALSNIEKHSGAKEVTLTARNKDDKALLIYVTDDGKGLHRNMANTRRSLSEAEMNGDGLGIRGMRQRALMLGASLSFVEGAGSGLTVRLEVPLSMSN